MNKILVTGGMGFIGSHTVDALVAEGHNVVVLDNLEKQVHLGKRPAYLNKKAKYIVGDVRFQKDWLKALKGVSHVIHLAACVGIGQSFWESRKYNQTNVVGTSNLFELLTRDAALRKSVEKVVVASSKSLYGEGAYRCPVHGVIHPLPRSSEQLRQKDWDVRCSMCGSKTEPVGITEDKPPQNLNPYSLSKYATERLALSYSSALGMPAVAFRYFNVYGPRQSLSNPYTGVLAIFISRLKNGNKPVVFEDGKQLRDFIYVGDIARANMAALEKGEGAYNLGTGRPSSLLQVISMLNDALGTNIEPEVTNEFRPGDNRHDFSDSTRFLKAFGPRMFTGLSDGITELAEWSSRVKAKDNFTRAEEERRKYISTG